jgi:antitoxin ParD1/3/4
MYFKLIKLSIFATYRHLILLDMNISFTKKQEIYINKQVETGDYQNNSEVIRDALRLHEIYREKVITDLRNEIEKGWSSESSDRSIADIIAAEKAAYAKK